MNLTSNASIADRIIRLVLGVALGAVAVAGTLGGPLLYTAWIVAALLVVTGAIGFCPLYALLGIRTKPKAA